MKYLMFLLTFLLLLSCSNEQIVNPVLSPIDNATTGVKSKIFYPSLESTQILSTEEFEYNNQDQLLRKIYYGDTKEMVYHYELFNYDNDGKLINKLNYHNNVNSPTGFILLDSTVYLYSENFLTTEEITYPYSNIFTSYSYIYDGKNLVKKTKYHNDALESYSTFEYKNGNLSKEITYDKNSIVIESKEYKYTNLHLAEIVIYSSTDEAKRKIQYSYNGSGKIVLEEVDELLIYSSSLPYVVKYVY
ncbi:MAG: hypothetical protein PF551_00675 [Candidatus Marinimicrobia bacterium]|nr:hypothetical protein [Candidatus Neomarinimicrobiota bacterium]